MTYVPKILSGIDVIDQSWGGMFQGGTYLCFGHAASGRGLMGMLFLKMGTLLEEKSLLVSPGRPQDWKIQADSVDYNLEQARNAGWVRMMWVPSRMKSQAGLDEAAAQALNQLVRMVRHERPARLLIDDFTPFLQFTSFERFRQAFVDMMGQLEDINTTLLLMTPDAVNIQTKQIIGFMRNHMSGSIHVALKELENKESKRIVTLLPGLGHVNHEVIENWAIPHSIHPDHPINTNKRKAKIRKVREKRKAASKRVRAGTLDSLSEVSVPLVDMNVSSVAIESLRALKLEHEAFYEQLRHAFQQRAGKKKKSFLLIALRIDQVVIKEQGFGYEASTLLSKILPAIERIMKRKNDLMVDHERHRLVVFLPETEPDEVNTFFASIQDSMRVDHPDIAEQLPHIVSAVVVPDGEPFESPEDFMAYAMEER